MNYRIFEKVIVVQAITKCLTFYGNPSFIAVSTSTRHWAVDSILSQMDPVHVVKLIFTIN
jgi:hypothetical protein